MAVTAKKLADGLAASSAAIVYTTPVSKTAIVSNATFHNTDTQTRTLSLYVRAGVNDRRLLKVSLAADATLFFTEKVVVEAEDSILVEADASGVVVFYISGAEITA